MAEHVGHSTRGRRRLLGSRLPTRTAVYRLFGLDGQLLYVGIATDPHKRLGDHRRHKAWWPQARFAEIQWFADRPNAEDEELWSIRTENPAFNINGRGGPLRRRETPDRQKCIAVQRVTFRGGA